MRDILHEMKFNYSKKSRVVFLDDASKKKRLDHCLTIKNTINPINLQGIVFSDESYFKSNYESQYSWQQPGMK